MTHHGELDQYISIDAPWERLRVVVTGIGVSGFPAAMALALHGANVTVVDAADTPANREKAQSLQTVGAQVLLGPDSVNSLPTWQDHSPDLVVTSPGWQPTQPLLKSAAAQGIPIWGEVELAWRMRPATNPAPWLCVTGTNGKTTTVRMAAAMLNAAGFRAGAAGNVGTALIDVVTDPHPYEVIVVELSSFQLYWSDSISPLASVCLNIAPDHVDWHGGFEGYRQAKAKVYERTQVACLYNVADHATEAMVREAEVQPGCRAVGFTTGVPGLSMLGVVDDILCDRAFIEQRESSAQELASFDDVRAAGGGTLAPHLVSNALAAAGLARTFGAGPMGIKTGLQGFRLDDHRIATIDTIDQVTWVDDSKATNAHAAHASLSAYESVVWVAGGLAKGAQFDDLVAAHAHRLRAVVLIGTDKEPLRSALKRHASSVMVVEVDIPDTEGMAHTDTAPDTATADAANAADVTGLDDATGSVGADGSDDATGSVGAAGGGQTESVPAGVALMREVVAQCAALAQAGDTVLLAPASASMDQFDHYGQRGQFFADAVARLREGGAQGPVPRQVTSAED